MGALSDAEAVAVRPGLFCSVLPRPFKNTSANAHTARQKVRVTSLTKACGQSSGNRAAKNRRREGLTSFLFELKCKQEGNVADPFIVWQTQNEFRSVGKS
jgi:hypothetical protein